MFKLHEVARFTFKGESSPKVVAMFAETSRMIEEGRKRREERNKN
jgi:hypothetical protein